MCCDAMLRRTLTLPRPMGRANPSLLIRQISIGRKLPASKGVPVPAFRAQTDAPLWGAGGPSAPYHTIPSICNVLCHVESFSAHFQLFTPRARHTSRLSRGEEGKKSHNLPRCSLELHTLRSLSESDPDFRLLHINQNAREATLQEPLLLTPERGRACGFPSAALWDLAWNSRCQLRGSPFSPPTCTNQKAVRTSVLLKAGQSLPLMTQCCSGGVGEGSRGHPRHGCSTFTAPMTEAKNSVSEACKPPFSRSTGNVPARTHV